MPAMDYAKIADLYDAYVQTDLDISFFLKETEGSNRVLELMSGTGRVSVPLARAGVNLTCVDSSPEMLARLRGKLGAEGLAAQVMEMDVCELSLPERFDVIILPFHSFAEILHPSDQLQALQAIRAHLVENGRFICTLHNPPQRLRTVDGLLHLRGHFALPEDKGTVFLWSQENYAADKNVVHGVQFYEIYNPEGVLESKRFVDLRFYLHDKDGFAALARKAGLRIDTLYGDYDRSQFDEQASAFMICELVSAENQLGRA